MSKKPVTHLAPPPPPAARKVSHANEPSKRISAAIFAIEAELKEEKASFDQQIEPATTERKAAEKAFLEARSHEAKLQWESTRKRAQKWGQLERLKQLPKLTKKTVMSDIEIKAEFAELGIGPPLTDDEIPAGRFNLTHAILEYEKAGRQRLNDSGISRLLGYEPIIDGRVDMGDAHEKAKAAGDLKLASAIEEFEKTRPPFVIPAASGLRLRLLSSQKRTRYEQRLRETDPFDDRTIDVVQEQLAETLRQFDITKNATHLWQALRAAVFLNPFGVLVPSVDYTALFIPLEVMRLLERTAERSIQSDLGTNGQKRRDQEMRRQLILEIFKKKKKPLDAGQILNLLKSKISKDKIPTSRTVYHDLEVLQPDIADILN